MRRRLHQRRPAVQASVKALRQGATLSPLVDAWFFSMTVVTSAL
jgi:hypothetical protein